MSLSAVSTALQTMAAALDAAGPIASASGSTAQAAEVAIQAALTAAQTYVASLPANVATATWVAAQDMLASVQIVASNFQTGQAPTVLNVSGVDLCEIASVYYGDATLFKYLMQANGLFSRWVPNGPPISLVIPPPPSTSQQT